MLIGPDARPGLARSLYQMVLKVEMTCAPGNPRLQLLGGREGWIGWKQVAVRDFRIGDHRIDDQLA